MIDKMEGKKSEIITHIVLIFTLTVVIFSLVSLIFPALLVTSIVGSESDVNSFELGAWAIPLLAVLMIGAAVTPAYSVPTSIDIDIKPGSDPNSINPRSMGLVPVAILGTANFDVGFVDVPTSRFGPDGAAPAHDGHIEDVNGDGLDDAVFHFDTQDVTTEDTDLLCLSGEISGLEISGCDSVTIKDTPAEESEAKGNNKNK